MQSLKERALIYLLLADHNFEILADRGIHHHIGYEGCEKVIRAMEAYFKQGDFEVGVLHGIAKVTEYLDTHFPADAESINELANAPIVI